MNGAGWVHLLLSFEGRIARRPFWQGLAVVAAAGAVLGVVPALAGRMTDPAALVVVDRAAAAAVVALLLPLAALATKRWHDRGRSGCRSLVVVIPVAGIAYLLYELGAVPGMSERFPHAAPASRMAAVAAAG